MTRRQIADENMAGGFILRVFFLSSADELQRAHACVCVALDCAHRRVCVRVGAFGGAWESGWRGFARADHQQDELCHGGKIRGAGFFFFFFLLMNLVSDATLSPCAEKATAVGWFG